MDLIWKKLGQIEELPDEAEKWVDKRVTMVTEVADPISGDSALIKTLEEVARKYSLEVLEDLHRPSFFLSRFKKRRYVERSKPRPHEFGPADAKSVLRRVRDGHAVSRSLLARAVKTLVDEAGYYSED